MNLHTLLSSFVGDLSPPLKKYMEPEIPVNMNNSLGLVGAASGRRSTVLANMIAEPEFDDPMAMD